MKSPNYIHFFTKLSLFIIIALTFFVFWNIDKVLAINNCNDGWQIAVGQTKQINCHGVCKKVTNNCSKTIFVPTRTSSEWAEFRSNKPGCVSLSNCCTDECSSGQTDYRCSGDWVQKRTCGNYDADSCLEWSSWSNYENCSSKPTDCGYGTCSSDERPSWYCSNGSCKYSCSYDSSCQSGGPWQCTTCASTDPPMPEMVDIGETLKFYVVNPQSGYTYSWSGACTGTGTNCFNSFSQPGLYKATVCSEGECYSALNGVCEYGKSHSSCSSAYNFGTHGNWSAGREKMCGEDIYYKITIPANYKCDVEWKLSYPPTFNGNWPSWYSGEWVLYTKWDGSCPSQSNYDCSKKASPLYGYSTEVRCQKTGLSGGTYYAYVKGLYPAFTTRAESYYNIWVTLKNCEYWKPCDPSGITYCKDTCGEHIGWGWSNDGKVCCNPGDTLITGACKPKDPDDFVKQSKPDGNCWYCEFGCNGWFCGADGCGYVKCRD